jgi:hypothetical protein
LNASLRFGELLGTQTIGHLLTIDQEYLEIFPGGLQGRQVQPHVGGHVILGDALAKRIQRADLTLRLDIAQLGGVQ